MGFNSFYINKIISNVVDEDVHKHLVKYSKGEFPGPDLLIKKKGSKFTIAADYEYASFLEFLFISEIGCELFNLKGKIYTVKDISSELKELGVSSMKTSPPLYYADISGSFNRGVLLKILECEAVTAILLNIKPEGGLYSNIKTGSRIPKPKIERSETPPSFIIMRLDTGELRDSSFNILTVLVPDLSTDKHACESIKVESSFTINELVFPPDRDKIPRSQLRYSVKRKGYLTRRITADNSIMERVYPF
ncbi:MAG: hypothetical protein QW327_02380 [Candidatus Odinarchaeota archaeon]